MKKTAIVNLYPYLKGSYPIGIGTTGICYLMKDKRVLKIFLNTCGTEYLFSKYENILDHFDQINTLKNDSYIVPEELLIKDKQCVAYIYDYIESRTLKYIKLNTKIDSLLYGYDKLYEDTKDISNKKFCLYDLHDKNILFNGNYKIIDLDKGTFENEMTEENIFKNNMNLINKIILYSLFRIKNDKIMDFYNIKLSESYKKNIMNDYKGMKDFFKDLQNTQKNIKTVFDMKLNSNKLIYTMDNDYYRHY